MEDNLNLSSSTMTGINLTPTTPGMVNAQIIKDCKKEGLKYKYMNGDVHPIYPKQKKKQKSLLDKLCKLVGL